MSTSTFIQQINVVTGCTEWVQESEDYDYHQEVARSAYADMLHDHDRNMKYYEGLRLAIEELRRRQEKVVVLDIGTGTGLLSMMAARLGADTIYACEAFAPMAKCAASVIKHNGFTDRIKLIPKRSTDLEVGAGKDLETKANVLVTEVFDTELIGEGAIGTYNHAHEFLLAEGAFCIPTSGTYYAQVVDCPVVPTWNKLNPINFPGGNVIHFPNDINDCPGVPSVHDVQLSEIKAEEFTPLSNPLVVFQFDFAEHCTRIPITETNVAKFQALNNNPSTAVFTWWELQMSSTASNALPSNTITMKPTWADDSKPAWRDHWMQSIYYIPRPLHLNQKTEYYLKAFHDEYSFWFQVTAEEESPDILAPVCNCGVHIAMSRCHIGLFNDISRHQKYFQIFGAIVNEESVCLVLSDSSALPFLLAGLGAKKVFALESNGFSQRAMRKLVEHSGFEDSILLINNLEDPILNQHKIDIVAGDPCFHASVLPWHNLCYWYSLQSINHLFSSTVKLFPSKAVLKLVLVEYRDLWKIRSSVGKVCNGDFDIVDFDNLIQNSSDVSDAQIDAQPLWEYPSETCSEAFTLLRFDFGSEIQGQSSTIEVKCPVKSPNGVALWMEWHHVTSNGETVVISTGPIGHEKIEPGVCLSWDRNCKQGVYFFQNEPEGKTVSVLCTASFSAENGSVGFSFKPIRKQNC